MDRQEYLTGIGRHGLRRLSCRWSAVNHDLHRSYLLFDLGQHALDSVVGHQPQQGHQQV